MKAAFENSRICKLFRLFAAAFARSRLKGFADAFSRCFEYSAIGRGLARFGRKRPRYQYSVYQKTLDCLSGRVSAVMLRARVFFERLISGSAFCRALLGFVNNEAGNRLRGVGVFGFYFFLMAAMLGVFGIIGIQRALPSFILSLAFFAAAFFADKLAAALKSSFIFRLFMGLIE